MSVTLDRGEALPNRSVTPARFLVRASAGIAGRNEGAVEPLSAKAEPIGSAVG